MPNTSYWEPHTASIDFCEENYLATNYIVEIHNVWSSFLICGCGMMGYLQTTPILPLRRFQLYWLLLIITGLGSSLLHASGQRADLRGRRNPRRHRLRKLHE